MAWTAQVWVKWNSKFPAKGGWDWLTDWKEVKSAWSTMGDWDMVFNVETKTPEELEQFVMNKLRGKDWVADTRSIWTHEVWHRGAA